MWKLTLLSDIHQDVRIQPFRSWFSRPAMSDRLLDARFEIIGDHWTNHLHVTDERVKIEIWRSFVISGFGH